MQVVKEKPIFNKFTPKESVEVTIVPHLENIKVTLMHAPTIEQLQAFIPEFCCAAWGDVAGEGRVFEHLKATAVEDLFAGKLLPTALEAIELVFKIEGMDLTDATHLIRHRTLGFSAQALGDRDLRQDRLMCKESILANEEFARRTNELFEQLLFLYADMVDSGEVSTFDARTILPRGMETYYYVRGNIKDIMAFIRLRKDQQIHPASDNVIAMLMWKEVVTQYPFLAHAIDFTEPDKFYVSVANTEYGHNIFPPAPKNDLFEWDAREFTHPRHRDEYPGGEAFKAIEDEFLYWLEGMQMRQNEVIK